MTDGMDTFTATNVLVEYDHTKHDREEIVERLQAAVNHLDVEVCD